jgi:hypothetical protein
MPSTMGWDDDELRTLPPLPPDDESDLTERRRFYVASGDFRTYETTFAAVDGGLLEVRVTSERGDAAQFAFEDETAARVARELERQLSEPYYRYSFLNSRPPGPNVAALGAPGCDVCFLDAEKPTVRAEQEAGGDRIVLQVWSDDASLNIAMQVGVAIALRDFLSEAADARIR